MALSEFLREPALISFAAIFLAIFLKYFIFKKKPHYNLPPGPPKLPIIGNLHHFKTSDPHNSLQNLVKKYGPIIHVKFGQISTVIISSARVTKEAFKNHDLALSNRPRLMASEVLFYNRTDVAFAPYNAYWRYSRKVCIVELLSAKRVQSYSSARIEEVARLVRRISEPYPNTVNVSKLLGRYSNNVLCRVAFGREFSEGGEYDRQGFHEMLELYQDLLGGLQVGDFFPSLEFIASLTGMRKKLVIAFKRFDKLFDQIIAEHLDPNRKKEETKDIVDVLLDIQRDESAEMPLTMDNVKALILDMFAAGTDTSSVTLEWAMTELIINPEVLKKVQAEVRSVVGERKVVLESDLPQLNYLKAVIKETLRLHAPAPLSVPRESMEDVTIDGYNIPAKTRFLFNVWTIGRDPESWEDPLAFKPERFLGTNIDFKGQDFEFLPFGFGRRICPGIAFVSASVELVLSQLLHCFDWELPPGIQAKDVDMTQVFGLTMRKKVGLELIAKPHFT